MKKLTEENEKLKKQLEDADDLIKTLVKFAKKPWSDLMNTLNGEHLEASNPTTVDIPKTDSWEPADVSLPAEDARCPSDMIQPGSLATEKHEDEATAAQELAWAYERALYFQQRLEHADEVNFEEPLGGGEEEECVEYGRDADGVDADDDGAAWFFSRFPELQG